MVRVVDENRGSAATDSLTPPLTPLVADQAISTIVTAAASSADNSTTTPVQPTSQ